MAEGEVNEEAFRNMFGPAQIDQMIRQAIIMCWMAMPKDQKNVERVEAQVRRLVERAIKDLREDASSFGLGVSK